MFKMKMRSLNNPAAFSVPSMTLNSILGEVQTYLPFCVLSVGRGNVVKIAGKHFVVKMFKVTIHASFLKLPLLVPDVWILCIR